MLAKYFENKLVPIKNIEDKKARELILGITDMKDLVLEHYELRLFSKLTKLLMTQVEALNEFVSHKEPWILAKNEDQHKLIRTSIKFAQLVFILLGWLASS